MARTKKNMILSASDLKKQQADLFTARIKNSLRSLENISTIRATKKIIAQQKTALTVK